MTSHEERAVRRAEWRRWKSRGSRRTKIERRRAESQRSGDQELQEHSLLFALSLINQRNERAIGHTPALR